MDIVPSQPRVDFQESHERVEAGQPGKDTPPKASRLLQAAGVLS